MHTPVQLTKVGILWLLIVCIYAALTTPTRGVEQGAERIQHWGFQRDNDHNFDLKPDGWKRRQDRQHPAYVDMRINPRSAETSRTALAAQSTLANWAYVWKTGKLHPDYMPESTPQALSALLDRTVLDNCLEISMDGGAAELVGPTFPVENRYGYTMSAEMSCSTLHGHSAWVELHLLDSNGQLVQILRTDQIGGDADWRRLQTDIASHPSSDLKWGQVHLRVVPHSSTALAGVARFDNVAVYRMPWLTLRTALKYHLARPGEEFTVECQAMGIREHQSQVHFVLRDHLGNELQNEMVALQTNASSEPLPATDRATGGVHYVATRPQRRSDDGQAEWNLKLDQPGLYRVQAALGFGIGEMQRREILIGVMADKDHRDAGPFGWSLAPFDERLSLDQVPELVQRFGAGWIKLPVWFDPSDPQGADQLIALIERLQSQRTQVVGKLEQPPARFLEKFGGNQEMLYAVNIFREPNDWEPALEPVLTRIGMKLAWFQIGGDSDHSFIGKSELAATISNLRDRMQTYCQELKLALNWNWLDPPPEASSIPWNAIHYSTAPQFTAAELEAYMAQAGSSDELWVSIDPLVGGEYRLLDRVRDLTHRMLAIKRSSATAAFVSDPLRPELRLFTGQQTVGELLLPWHELVSALGTAQYLGPIELPQGSPNHILLGQEEALMIVWNDNPTDEQLYLGHELTATDLFGRSIPLETTRSDRGTREQRIPVNQWPIIVRGINPAIVRFHLQFQLQMENLAGATSVEQSLPVSITNTLPQNASGSVTVVSPTLLIGNELESPVQLAANITQSKNLPIFVRTDASAGEHRLRFDFDLVSDDAYHFSIYRSVSVGGGEVELDWDVERKADGGYEVHVQVNNASQDSVAFDCKLFPAGKPYVRFRLREAKPGLTLQEIPIQVGDVPEGSEAWLRCEIIGSGRVLNYRIRL